MSEMVERVAEAIYNKWCEIEGTDATFADVKEMAARPGYIYSKKAYRTAMEEARAAIEAMREPDEDVVEAVGRIIWDNTGGLVEAWNAGINAALKGDAP